MFRRVNLRWEKRENEGRPKRSAGCQSRCTEIERTCRRVSRLAALAEVDTRMFGHLLRVSLGPFPVHQEGDPHSFPGPKAPWNAHRE